MLCTETFSSINQNNFMSENVPKTHNLHICSRICIIPEALKGLKPSGAAGNMPRPLVNLSGKIPERGSKSCSNWASFLRHKTPHQPLQNPQIQHPVRRKPRKSIYLNIKTAPLNQRRWMWKEEQVAGIEPVSPYSGLGSDLPLFYPSFYDCLYNYSPEKRLKKGLIAYMHMHNMYSLCINYA